MDPHQGFPTEEDQSERPTFPPQYHHSLQLHNLLASADGTLAANGLSRELLARQFAGTEETFASNAELYATRMQDYMPHQPRKRKMEHTDHHFASSLQFDPARQLSANVPSSSLLLHDPPPEESAAKRAKVMSSSNHPDTFFAAASPHGSLPNSTRGTLHSFPNPVGGALAQGEGLQMDDPYRTLPIARAPLSLTNVYGRADSQKVAPATTREKGGIFDDADSDDESMDVIQAKQDPAVRGPLGASSSCEEVPTTGGGGIFDDAEEDLEFVPPSYESIAPVQHEKQIVPPSFPTNVSSMHPKINANYMQTIKPQDVEPEAVKPEAAVPFKKTALPSSRTASPVPGNTSSKAIHFKKRALPSSRTVSPVRGNTSSDAIHFKKSALPSRNASPVPGNTRAASPVPANTSSNAGAAKKSAQKKKKPLKPTKRVLVARKERDLATSVLDGKDDLRGVIDLDHCSFLGKEFWIFTVQQLEHVLVGPHDEASAHESWELLRRKLVQKVAQSDLVIRTEGPGGEEAAESLLRSWHQSIEQWKERDQSVRDISHEKKFPLDGPAACLFSKNILCFLASIPILSLYDFLCLKKTETGAVIAYCLEWRRRCGMADGTPLALAKHFLGMGLRVETAITSVPPPDAATRKWMGDPLVVLTGAAKEFLIDDKKILEGKVFIETRTKDLANSLMEWRARKGLPPLKGSGKVAMVSGWKANVKEAIDLEEGQGKTLHNIDFQAILEELEGASVAKVEEKRTVVSAKPPPQQEFTFDPRIPDVEAALHSNSFLKEVMDSQHIGAMRAAGIKTADELFSAQKKQGSPLAREVVKIIPDPSQFELVIFDWCQIVRKKLSCIRRVHSTSKMTGDPAPYPPETKAKKKVKQPIEAAKELTPRPSKAQLLQKDPFYSLSAVTQTFLKTLGIETAMAFMTSRTTDLSSAFVEFRAKHNMSVLKGQGSIASVSGWKANIRKIAKERGLEDLANAAPPIPAPSPKQKPKSAADPPTKVPSSPKLKQAPVSPLKKFASSPRLATGTPESKVLLSHPDVLFGRPSKKLVVESARDPRIRFYFEISIRKTPEHIAMFISYIGARKLTTVNSDYSRIHQRSFSIVGDCDGVSDVSLLVAKDLSKKIKKDPNSSSAAGKDIRVPFSSLEDGCGLIELCKHDVWPLPWQNEAGKIWPALESFIHQEKTTEIDFETNVVVGKDESGRSQYFLFLNDPLERGQCLEIKFCSPKSKKRRSTVVPIDSQWRRNVEGMLSRLSRRGLRSLLRLVSLLIVEKIDKLIAEMTQGSDSQSDSDQIKVFVSRRRAHWVASKIISQLHGQETKGAKTKSGGIDLSREIADCYDKVAWTPQLVKKLKEHPKWTNDAGVAIVNETRNEFEVGIKSNEFLNSGSRLRWCSLAKDLYKSLLPRIETFSAFLDPSFTQEIILAEIRQASMAFAKHLHGVSAESENGLEKLVMTFEELTDGQGSPSPDYKHVLRTSVEQGYRDALALCDVSAVDIAIPQVQQVLATCAKSDAPDNTAPLSEKAAKEAAKKPEEASFRTLQDVKRGSAKIHQAWYLRFQLLQVLNSLLSVSPVLLEGGISLKVPALKAAESALMKLGVEELTKFEKSTLSVLAGTPVTFPSEVTDSVYQPKPLPLFLGLIWPLLRTSHWKLEAGETPTDFSFLPPGQSGRRQRADKRAKILKQERTRSRIKFAKASNALGLGVVPKLTKRVLTSSTIVENTEEPKSSTDNPVPPTVAVALERFLQRTKSEMREDNADAHKHKRVELIVIQIRETFDALFNLDNSIDNSDGKRPSDILGCEHLARFVLIAPSILRQADLSEQILGDTTLLLKELASFLAVQHKQLLAPAFCPPQEFYVGDTAPLSILASRLEKPRSARGDSAELGDLTEAILPEDRPDVTDFVNIVMSQVVPCRATQEDTGKRGRKISVGFTGMVCRHCWGSKGEGRYFFASIESMTTAATVIEKHIQKCTMVPPDVKAKMAEARSRHAEQRKTLGQGTQAAFFLRLWERLRAAKVKGTAASLQTLQMNDIPQQMPADDAETPGGLEFESHVHLIEFLKKEQPWSERQDVVGALQRYYEGMELGGRLYKTDAMPRNFNSEWLLSKMLASTPQSELVPPITIGSKPPSKP